MSSALADHWLVQALGWAIVHSLWQGVVIAAMAALLLPAIQMRADEMNGFPERPRGARHAAALEFHCGRGDLDHAGVAVHRGTVRKMIRGAGAVYERLVDEAARIAKDRRRIRRSAIDHQRQLRLEPHRCEGQPIARRPTRLIRPRRHDAARRSPAEPG